MTYEISGTQRKSPVNVHVFELSSKDMSYVSHQGTPVTALLWCHHINGPG